MPEQPSKSFSSFSLSDVMLEKILAAAGISSNSSSDENSQNFNPNLNKNGNNIDNDINNNKDGNNNNNDNNDNNNNIEDDTRPPFSVSLMARNFRRLNARIGVIFSLQAFILRLVTWKTKHKSQSIACMAIWAFLCLYPRLLTIFPAFIIISFIMTPAYITRHPPAPSYPLPICPIPSEGPPLADAPTLLRPVSELSRDFLENMRNVQNAMDDASNAYDAFVSCFLTPLSFKGDEVLSTLLYLLIIISSISLYLVSPYIPWNWLAVFSGWSIFIVCHPNVSPLIVSFLFKKNSSILDISPQKVIPSSPSSSPTSSSFTPNKNSTNYLSLPSKPTSTTIPSSSPAETVLQNIANSNQDPKQDTFSAIFNSKSSTPSSAQSNSPPSSIPSSNNPDSYSLTKSLAFKIEQQWQVLKHEEIVIDQSFSYRTVEIFEIQRMGHTVKEWNPWLFASTSYQRLDASRLMKKKPPGSAKTLEEVNPPNGWSFDRLSHWMLDMHPARWVADRAIPCVRVDNNEKWVYDFDPSTGFTGEWRRRRWTRKCLRCTSQ